MVAIDLWTTAVPCGVASRRRPRRSAPTRRVEELQVVAPALAVPRSPPTRRQTRTASPRWSRSSRRPPEARPRCTAPSGCRRWRGRGGLGPVRSPRTGPRLRARHAARRAPDRHRGRGGAATPSGDVWAELERRWVDYGCPYERALAAIASGQADGIERGRRSSPASVLAGRRLGYFPPVDPEEEALLEAAAEPQGVFAGTRARTSGSSRPARRRTSSGSPSSCSAVRRKHPDLPVVRRRRRGRDRAGIVTVGTQFAFIAAAGTRFGMDMASVRYVAIEVGAGHPGRVRTVVARSVLIAARSRFRGSAHGGVRLSDRAPCRARARSETVASIRAAGAGDPVHRAHVRLARRQSRVEGDAPHALRAVGRTAVALDRADARALAGRQDRADGGVGVRRVVDPLRRSRHGVLVELGQSDSARSPPQRG